jgi:hypothetical protein
MDQGGQGSGGALAPGAVLGQRFRLEARLGRGGYGDVWRASELLPDGSVVREVALKLLAPAQAGADWSREAKVLASLRHPALVTVFSAGLLDLPPQTPFVAMELLAGRTLADFLAERGRIPWRRALALALEVASALDLIHGQGIVHLDLKPSNLMLLPDGAVRVLDFGIALHKGATSAAAPAPLTEGESLATGALLDLASTDDHGSRSSASPVLVGTPGYMAPEVLEGRAATHAADAYALGACLFQLLAGRLPQRAREPGGRDPGAAAAWRGEVRAATVGGDLLDLRALVPETPLAVSLFVSSLLSLDPAHRPAPGTLAARCREVAARPHGTPEPPYLGLRAFGREAEGFLFGREGDGLRLGAELARVPCLVLQGASGSGKSSLAVAGVVPALARTFADDRDDWVPVVVRPGQDIEAALRRAREQEGEHVGLVLVVDQLEEVVTQLSAEEKARFVPSLLRHAAAAPPAPGLRVLCTLREDFTTRVAALGSLGELLERAVRFVPPPSPASVRDIVVAPAALAGVRVDDDRPVVDDVLKELRSGEGRLPLVAFALSEWWRTRQGRLLSVAEWRRIGGVAGALSRHADATMAALPPATWPAARDLSLRLATPEGTRARVPEHELRAIGPDHSRVLDAFLDARLVSIDDEHGASFSHEALIGAWGALTAWVDEERADRSEAASLAAIARLWRGASKADRAELLLRGTRLTRALDLQRSRPDLVASVLDLIGASRSRALRERVLTNGLGVLILGSAAGALLFYAFETRRHEVELRVREENLRTIVAQYHQLEGGRAQLATDLDARTRELGAAQAEGRSCQDALRRVEQENRTSLAHRYGNDTFEHRVATFLLRFEHSWNLHDRDRIGSYFAPDVQWFGFDGAREDLVRSLADTWHQAPTSRFLLGEVSITRKGTDETHVRMTREERTGGQVSVAVAQLVIRSEKIEGFQIERGTLEKTIVPPKNIGCP